MAGDFVEAEASLLDFLDLKSGSVVSDSSRTSLEESLQMLADKENENAANTQQSQAAQQTGSTRTNQTNQENETNFTRAGGILGIPRKVASGVGIVQVLTPRGTNAGSGLSYVTFHPDGTAEDIDVYLQNRSGRTFKVSVTQSTGRIGIRELSDKEIEDLGLNTGLEQ